MFLKFAKFQKVRTERNKRLLNMSATLRRRCQTSLGAGSRCKGTIKFADVQILSRKSIRSFKSYKVIGLFREIDKSTFLGINLKKSAEFLAARAR